MKQNERRFPIFADRFRELQGNKSNTEFAAFLEMSRQTVGFYLNGDRIPDALNLRQICEKCNVSADWLIGLTDTRTLDIKLKAVTRYTGLSEKAIEVIRQLNDFRIKGIEYPYRRMALNRILEHSGLLSLIESVAGAACFLSWTFRGENISFDEFREAIRICEAMGYPVLKKDEVREYCIQQSAKRFSEIVKDIDIPGELYRPQCLKSVAQRADDEK